MKQTIITALLALVTIAGQGQTSFDLEEGCLNVIDNEAYLVKAFDTQRNDYKNKLIHDLGISIGACFQINGW